MKLLGVNVSLTLALYLALQFTCIEQEPTSIETLFTLTITANLLVRFWVYRDNLVSNKTHSDEMISCCPVVASHAVGTRHFLVYYRIPLWNMPHSDLWQSLKTTNQVSLILQSPS